MMPYFEWDRTIKELISQNADAPDIDFTIVILGLNHFWWGVKRGSTLSVSKKRRMNSPSKVTQFDRILYHQYVFRLDIPMNNIVFVHILDCPTNFLYVTPHVLLSHRFTTLSLVQIVARTCLQQQINSLCISGKTVQVDDIRMAQKALNFALPYKLCEGLFVQMAFFNSFEAINSISIDMLNEVNFSIAAFIKEFQDLEDLLFVIDHKDFELILF